MTGGFDLRMSVDPDPSSHFQCFPNLSLLIHEGCPTRKLQFLSNTLNVWNILRFNIYVTRIMLCP